MLCLFFHWFCRLSLFIIFFFFFFLRIRRPPRSTRTDTLFPYTTLFRSLVDTVDHADELSFTVVREKLADAMVLLRDKAQYQQLMEIAGVDYPERPERFEVCYHLLSVTRNHRVRVKVSTDEDRPVPTVTHIWPVAGWLEREVFDMYGVIFEGNADLRRILRSEERRVGRECVSTCKSRGWPEH